jgi:hypothetical protein
MRKQYISLRSESIQKAKRLEKLLMKIRACNPLKTFHRSTLQRSRISLAKNCLFKMQPRFVLAKLYYATVKFYIRLKQNAYDLLGGSGWFDGEVK